MHVLNIVVAHVYKHTNAKINVVFYLLALSCWGRLLLFGRATFSGVDTESKSMPLLMSISSQLLSQSECAWPHSHTTSMLYSLIPIPPVSFPYHQYNFYHIPMLLTSLTLLCGLLCQVFCCHARVCGDSTVQAHYPGERCLLQKVRNSPSLLLPLDLSG